MKNRKLLVGLLALSANGALLAQNTSYAPNNSPIGGFNSTAFGFQALATNTGNNNCATGFQSMRSNNQGFGNTACGFKSLYTNIIGLENTAIGSLALYFNTGSRNSAMGSQALYNNSTGIDNTASGWGALSMNTTGSSNTAFGSNCLSGNPTGKMNTAVGHGALSGNTGDNNVSMGYLAMMTNTGHNNTSIGTNAMMNNASGSDNTVLGYNSGLFQSTGSKNTYLGANTTQPGGGGLNNATAVGANALVNNNNRVWLGTAADDVWTGIGYFIFSDKRFKSSVKEEDVKGLEFIKLLRPVVYNFEAKKFTEHLTAGMPDSIRRIYVDEDFTKATQIRQTGFLAQEVEEAANKSGYNFSGVHKPEHDKDTYGLSYATFVVPLVKAVQEQQQIIDDQKAESMQQIRDLQKQIEELKQQITASQSNATGLNGLNADANGFMMAQNEPNPFSRETVIRYTLPKTVASAAVYVYDLSGKQVTSYPLNEKGTSITLTAEKLSPGIYIYSIIADGKVLDSKRMILADK